MSTTTAGRIESIELETGQLVPWPPAPGGFAQVDELLRRRVTLFYKAGTGRVRHPRVSAALIAELLAATSKRQPLLPMKNALGRGALKRRKTFTL